MELKIRENFITVVTEKIIPKAKLNKTTGKYEITYEDYKEFELSVGEKKVLKEICTNRGIDLESKGYIREPLICIEDENLFKEYNEIKGKLLTNITEEEKNKLEQRKYEIINKIVTDNMSFIETIINRRIAGMNNRENKEDIYQIGYEMVINYINDNYLIKGKFKNEIGQIIVLYITKKLSLENKSNKYEESIESQINKENTTLYYEDFESSLVESISQKQTIPIILSTLSKREQDILKLYFGFYGEEYTITEIAHIYGLTKQLIFETIINSIETIKNSIRMKYLNEISEQEIPYQTQDNYQNKKLEEFLIKSLPKDYLNEILKGLRSREKHLANLLFSDKDYSMTEMATQLKISPSYTSTTKNKVIIYIRSRIIETLEKEYQKEITYEEYIDYLMNLYQKQNRLKRGK